MDRRAAVPQADEEREQPFGYESVSSSSSDVINNDLPSTVKEGSSYYTLKELDPRAVGAS